VSYLEIIITLLHILNFDNSTETATETATNTQTETVTTTSTTTLTAYAEATTIASNGIAYRKYVIIPTQVFLHLRKFTNTQ
jgi:hypothetical protein